MKRKWPRPRKAMISICPSRRRLKGSGRSCRIASHCSCARHPSLMHPTTWLICSGMTLMDSFMSPKTTETLWARRRPATLILAVEALPLPTVRDTKPIWSTTTMIFCGRAASNFIYDVFRRCRAEQRGRSALAAIGAQSGARTCFQILPVSASGQGHNVQWL